MVMKTKKRRTDKLQIRLQHKGGYYEQSTIRFC